MRTARQPDFEELLILHLKATGIPFTQTDVIAASNSRNLHPAQYVSAVLAGRVDVFFDKAALVAKAIGVDLQEYLSRIASGHIDPVKEGLLRPGASYTVKFPEQTHA